MRTSRQHIYRLLERYRQDGLDAVDPRSRRPASNPNAVADEVIMAIVTLRETLTARGLDAGPATLQWHLARQQLSVPSTSTIRRILHHHGLITPQPRKRPRSSYLRFEAEQPNECWQSDFTHWALADGTDIEILNWLDDHSRYLLACPAYHRVAGPDVVASFTHTVARHGLPASTLTDNGSVYTSRFTHGHNDFERVIASLGITQKNGHPGHPQTQGKIERFHQTLKRWLTPRPCPTTIDDLQTMLDDFRDLYNTQRPHHAHHPRRTPEQACLARPKATPPTTSAEHVRIRHDTVDQFGKLTLRYGSRLHHLGIGITHTHTRRHPDHHNHRHRHQQTRPPPHRQPPHRPQPQLLAQPTENPGRWPGQSVTDDATHV